MGFIEENQSLVFAFTMLGLIFFAIKLLEIIWNLIKCLFPAKNLTERYGKGSWAFITGATDGIGKGFAIEFAKLGFNICLTARDEQKEDQSIRRNQISQ